MTRHAVTTDALAAPAGPFSSAIQHGGLTFLSGHVGEDPATGELIDGDAAAQAEQVLRNLSAVLAAAGKSLDDVLRVGIYLTDMADFAAVNAVYETFFSQPYPARTTIAVAALPVGAAVEMDAVAG
jgi:2-iminobutanoate/2-iminopropanoate deaminase